jgi:hypothetical protein
MKLKDNTEAKFGDIIRWNCWDNDDFVTWNMTGMYTRQGVIYLGGRIDFGLGIGQILEVEEVIEESENNDPDDCGIVKVGIATDLTRYINKYEMKKESED